MKREKGKFRRRRGMVFFLLAMVFLAWGSPPAQAKEERMVEIILDASGSMMGKLKSGETKLEGAKKAIEELLTKIPEETLLAFRAYGFQSAKEKKDCKDTRLLVPFGPLSANRQKIVDQVSALKALGFTPLSYSLTEAGKDFPQHFKGEKMVILVTDSKETCEGDPCALAQSLAKAEAKWVIHTVGFGVDEATRHQMECVARVTGGKYFAAEDTASLAREMGKAIQTAKKAVTEEKGLGTLKVEGATLEGHKVTKAETGEQVAVLSNVQSSIKVPAGLYQVTVGQAVWKGVQVHPNQTTVLKPGFIKVEGASLVGHSIVDPETGEQHGSVSVLQNNTAVMPGEYWVLFGKIPWPVTVKAGETTILRPGRVHVPNAGIPGMAIKNSAGQTVGEVSQTKSTEPLPPGRYVLETKGKKIPFTLKEGEVFTLEKK